MSTARIETGRAGRDPDAGSYDRRPKGRDAHRGAPGRRGPGPRGRHAETPTEIPAKGWLDILFRAFKEVSNDRLTLVAAGITFYLLLALAPTLAAFVSIYGLFFDPASVQEHLSALGSVLPGGAMDILNEQLNRLASADTQTLGFAFLLSLGLALWSANAGMKALFEGVNVAYDEVEERSFLKLTLVTMAFTVLTLAAMIGLIVLNLAFSGLTEVTPLGGLPDWAMTAITSAIALAALITFMAALYRWGPSRQSPRWEWITPGAIFAGIAIVIVSVAFSFYVANFGTYNETYGSLGAVIGFLTWLWLTVIVLLVGGEINSEMEHQTARDTTTGSPRPIGSRGAVMADSVGPTWRAKKDEEDVEGGLHRGRDGKGRKASAAGGAGERERMGALDDPAPRSSRPAGPREKAVGAAVLLGILALGIAKRSGGAPRP